MRYFPYDDNDDYKEEIDRFFSEDEEDDDVEGDEDIFILDDDIDLDSLSLLNYKTKSIWVDVDADILEFAIQILENSFFWKFRTRKTKLKLLKKTYYELIEIFS